MPILIAYASRYGATGEIAQAIARVLRQRGLVVDVRAAGEVARLEDYGAVVLGSALYAGSWLEDARELLQSFQEELAGLPLWLFSSGPTTPGDPVQALGGWTFPEDLRGLTSAIGPVGIALFAGKVDAASLSRQDWLVNRSLRGVSGDFRDWARIEAWARGIADSLEVALPAGQGPDHSLSRGP